MVYAITDLYGSTTFCISTLKLGITQVMIRAWAEDIARKVDGSDTEGEDSETSSDTGTVGTPMSVDALTQVWQKTRNQLDAAKALLEKRDRAFQKHLHQKLEAQNQEFQQKVRLLKLLILISRLANRGQARRN